MWPQLPTQQQTGACVQLYSFERKQNGCPAAVLSLTLHVCCGQPLAASPCFTCLHTDAVAPLLC
jgi:hypothetical protein